MHPTRACIHLDRLTHNLRLLRGLAGRRPAWPAIKANAYGHGLIPVARHLAGLGCDQLCVAHVSEAEALRAAGVQTRILLLSASLPEQAEAIVRHQCEPAVCTGEMITALAAEAQRQRRRLDCHLMVDTGMGRIGIRPDQAREYLGRCRTFPALAVRGIMSHFPCADTADKGVSQQGLDEFHRALDAAEGHGIAYRHMANSAAILDLPASHFDAVRPGIAIYGLRPSSEILNPRVAELRPVLEWKTRITFLKEVPAGTGLSYGHSYHTRGPALIATLPVGYGDGLHRNLSDNMDMLVRGTRCPQVGRITMDQSLVDVSSLRGRVTLGDEVVIIGRQGEIELTADELADKLGTINYEIVTAISARVPRILIGARVSAE
ncbi:MAG: alanine racemase [Pseudomonadota bacterium]